MQNFKPTRKTIVRCVISALAIINSILIFLGIAPFEISENAIYAIVSGLGDLYLAWGVWKNNPITKGECAIDQTVRKAVKEDGLEQVIGHLMVDVGNIIIDEEEETNGNTDSKEA